MTEFHLIATVKHYGQPFDLPGEPIATGADGLRPPLTKNGFRLAFWRVFSEASRIATLPLEVEWLGTQLTVSSAWVFRAQASTLNGGEGDDLVVVYRVSSDLDEVDLRAALDRARDGVERLELRMLSAWVEATADTPYADTLSAVVHGANKPAFKPAMDVWTDTTSETLPFALAFYYYALSVVFRIERAQMAVEMPAITNRLDRESMESIALIRLRLIDYDRYFLTLNLSASAEVEAAYATVAERLCLKAQHSRQIELNAAMEAHLSNVAQIAQERTARGTGRAVAVLAFLGIPLSIFSTFAGLSLDSGFPADPVNTAGRPAFAWLWLASIGVPLLIMGVIALAGRLEIARLRSRR